MNALSPNEILEIIAKQRKEKKQMTITEIFSISQELKNIDDNLNFRLKNYNDEMKSIEDFLEKQRNDLKAADAYESEEAFIASYDWKFEQIEAIKWCIAAIKYIQTQLPKLVLK